MKRTPDDDAARRGRIVLGERDWLPRLRALRAGEPVALFRQGHLVGTGIWTGDGVRLARRANVTSRNDG